MEAKEIVLKTRCDGRWGWNKYGREGVFVNKKCLGSFGGGE
jgi:hypothetical protein